MNDQIDGVAKFDRQNSGGYSTCENREYCLLIHLKGLYIIQNLAFNVIPTAINHLCQWRRSSSHFFNKIFYSTDFSE